MSTAPFQYVHISAYPGQCGRVLGDQIRAEIVRLRTGKGWSRPELAKRLKPPTSTQQIERLEKGQRELDPDWIERIAKALGVEPVDLIAPDERFDLTQQVADEVALGLARFVLRGEEPDQVTVQGLSILIQDLSATFAEDPQARRDPQVVRPLVRALARQRDRQSA